MPARTIVLVACAAHKLARRAPARKLYVSDLFQKSLAYAESLHPDAIYILSAKHGLLPLEQEIEPYNVTLNDMGREARRQWAQGVLAQLGRVADTQHDRFVILAGVKYRSDLTPGLAHVEVPMKGLPIGKQLQWLGEHT
ncbi:MAG: hypothetical protein GXX94_09145 [Chloroflexi bacterium]|nr:hypothetical protein [Chloroflexota bacterium]